LKQLRNKSYLPPGNYNVITWDHPHGGFSSISLVLLNSCIKDIRF